MNLGCTGQIALASAATSELQMHQVNAKQMLKGISQKCPNNDVVNGMFISFALLCFSSFPFLIRFKGAVRWYTVDLDLPPSKRWTALITDKKTDVRTLSSTFF